MKQTPAECAQELRTLAGLSSGQTLENLTTAASYLESLGELLAASQKMAAAFEELLDKYTKLCNS